jgi:hypothetical protein
VVLTNYGTATLTSATINWSINGVAQTPFSWTGSLAQNVNSAPITVGTFNFVSGNYTTWAASASPNGQTDGNSTNDASSATGAPAMGGTYTIGSGGNFPSFRAAVTALQSSGVCAPTVFQVINGTYTDTITIPQILGANATNTITFESQSGDSTLAILQGSGTFVVYLNGADYIRFRKLTIQNVGQGRVMDVNNGAQFLRVENCKIIGVNTTANSIQYLLFYANSTATDESGAEFRNNVMQYGSAAIYWMGLTSSPYETGLVIENNQIIDQAVIGMRIDYLNAPIVRNNRIDMTNNTSTLQYGIQGNNLFNATRVLNNDIRTNNYGGYFTFVNGTGTQRALIADNFINASNAAGGNVYGLYVNDGTYADYVHNTVSTYSGANNFTSYTLYDAAGSYKTFTNNIFRNNGMGGSSNYAAYVTIGTGNVFDYNDYWWPTGTNNIAYWSNYGNFGVNAWLTLRSGSYGGSNSVNIDPAFVSNTNLHHLNNSLNVGQNLLTTVPTDIDGQVRTTPVTIGADEYKPVANDAGVQQVLPGLLCVGVNTVQGVIQNSGTNTLTSATVNWSVNGVAQSPFAWTGSLNYQGVSSPISLGTISVLVNTPYQIRVWTTLPNNQTDLDTTNDRMTVTLQPSLSGTYTIGSGGTYPTFTTAVTALQSLGICGPTTFLVLNGTYNESVSIPQINGSSAVNTITFQSASGDSSTVILNGASGANALYLNGADYVTIRKITLQTSNYRCLEVNNGAHFNRIENCRLTGFNTNSTSASFAVIYSSNSLMDTSNVIQNNAIRYGSMGIFWSGNSTGSYEPGLIFRGNSVTNAYAVAANFQYLDAPQIQNNLLNISTTTYSGVSYGLYGYYLNNAYQITGNDIRGINRGMQLANHTGQTASRGLIGNNYISVLPTATTTLYGIYASGLNYVDMHYNSVNVVNTFGATAYGFYDGANYNFDVRNNNFVIGGSGSANQYAVYINAGTSVTYNYNNYFVPSGSTNLAYHSLFGNFIPSNWNSFRQPSFGGLNSLNVSANYLSNTNLLSCNTQLQAGQAVTTLTIDKSGFTRPGTNPTIGAAEIVVPAAPVASAPTNITCSTARVNWTAGIGVTSYIIDVASDALFTNLVSGYAALNVGNTTTTTIGTLTSATPYYFRVRASASCVTGSNSTPITFTTMNLRDSIRVQSQVPVCISGTSVSLSSTGFTGVTYQWNGPNSYTSNQRNPVITPINFNRAGVYTLTASFTGCSPVSDTTRLLVNDSIRSVTATGNTPLCSGENLNLTSNGGYPGTSTYYWSGPNGFTAAISNPQVLSIPMQNQGIYTLTITSPMCNSMSDTMMVTVTPTIPVNPTVTTPVCEGTPVYFGSVYIPNGTYTWTGPNNFSWSGSTPSINYAAIANAGQYTLTATQPGCNPLTYYTTLQVGSSMVNTVPTNNSPVCQNDTLRMGVNSIPGVTYSWSGPNGFTGTSRNVVLGNVQTNQTGAYSLTANSPGCPTYVNVFNSIVNPAPAMSITASQTLICQGNNLDLNAIGNSMYATYNWSGPNGYTAGQGLTRVPAIQMNQTGYYYVQMNTPGCGSIRDSIWVQVTPSVTMVQSGSNTPVCAGGSLILSASAINGVNYAWTGPNGYSSGRQTDTIAPVTSNMAGMYTIQVSSGSCGTMTQTVLVQVTNTLNLAPVTNSPVCGGGILTLSAGGGRSNQYLWRGPNGFSSALQQVNFMNATPSVSGVYTLNVTVPSCGTLTFTSTTAVGNNLNYSNATTGGVICAGSNLLLSSTYYPDATYTWTGPNNFNSTRSNDTIFNATTQADGVYSVTIRTPGCLAVTRTTIATVYPALSASISSNSPICEGNNLYLSSVSQPNVSFAWTGPNGFTANNFTPSISQVTPIHEGLYTLTVSRTGCSQLSNTVSVTVGGSLRGVVATSNTPVCLGNTIGLSATNVHNAQYSWSGPGLFNSLNRIDSIPAAQLANAGAYNLTVTSPGCPSIVRTTNVVVDTVPQLFIGSNTPICQGSTLNFTNSWPNNYSTCVWSGPNGFTSTLRTPSIVGASPLASGVYTATVSGQCGVATTTTSVTVGTPFTGVALQTNSPVCVGSTLYLSSTVRSGYTYRWSGPNGFTRGSANDSLTSVTSLAGGEYTLQVSTPGCGTGVFVTPIVYVTNTAGLTASSTSPVCQGSFLYFSTGYMLGTTYRWDGPAGFSSSQQTPAISNAQPVSAGVYTLTATVSGCGAITSTTSVTVGTRVTGVSMGSNSPICQGSSLVFTASTVTGTATYRWTGPNTFTSGNRLDSITNAQPINNGVYTLTVTSPGCPSFSTTTAPVQVSNPTLFVPTANTPVCANQTLRLIAPLLTGAGGYAWTGPAAFTSSGRAATQFGVQPANAGAYTVTAYVPGCGWLTNTVTVAVVNCREGAPDPGQTEANGETQTENTEAYSESTTVTRGNQTLKIWPNPGEGVELYLAWGGLDAEDPTITIKVYDMQGRILLLKSIQRDDVTNDQWQDGVRFTLPLSSGQYMIETVQGGVTLRDKWLVR